MDNASVTEAAPTPRRTVVHPWISLLLALAVVVLASVQAFLIMEFSHYEQLRGELRAGMNELSRKRQEIVTVDGELQSLRKDKDALVLRNSNIFTDGARKTL